MEVRDLGGSGGSKAATKAASRALSEDPGGDAVRQTRFLGRAEVPLASTLTISNGEAVPAPAVGVRKRIRAALGAVWPPLCGQALPSAFALSWICTRPRVSVHWPVALSSPPFVMPWPDFVEPFSKCYRLVGDIFVLAVC